MWASFKRAGCMLSTTTGPKRILEPARLPSWSLVTTRGWSETSAWVGFEFESRSAEEYARQ